MQNNKLELTWYGKDKEPVLEPRILLEDKSKSFSSESKISLTDSKKTFGNMLIHGDNLLALKSLQKDFFGRVKCIYIDPPYNTGAIFEHYDDNLEHSTWLSLMYPRLKLLSNLLSEDGLFFCQIDDNEQAYLKILCDEIFGRSNFISTICVKMSTVSGVKTSHREKTIVKEKEMILVYSKNSEKVKIKPQYVPTNEWDKEFQYINLTNGSIDPTDWTVSLLKDALLARGIPLDPSSKEFTKFVFENKNNIWRRAFIRNDFKKISQDNPNKIFQNESEGKKHFYYRGREMFFLASKYHDCLTENGLINCQSNLLADIWLDINTGKLFNEGGIEFRNSKKPEFLISRILDMSTNEGDLVLDSFLGSGTTAAVAQKMNRHWIGIEMGEQINTLCIPRLKNVISGKDKGGVTLAFNYEGGGGYKFYELAPTLVVNDAFGEPIINKKYNADMLASAVALHEGFTYSPDKEHFWKQSKASENCYLFVTTMHIDSSLLDKIANDMTKVEFLIIACKTFDEECSKLYKNIVIKKIPEMLLGKCEFGKDDYSLNIINPPTYEDEDEDEDNEK